jgi:hypothetical protein
MSGRFHHALAVGALLALGCSDPVPPASRAAVRINIPGSGACPTTAATKGIGNPAPNSQGTEGKGGPISDGEQGVTTSCSVKGGPQYTVSAGVRQGAVSFSMTGSVNGTNAQGTATISVQTPDLADLFQSASNACTLTAVTTAQGIQVKPGAMWATYNCPMVQGPLATQVCRLQGDVVIENCD